MKFKYLFCFLSFVIVISLFISSTCAANLDCNSIVSSECSSNYSSISNNSFKQDNKFIMDNNFKISESNCVNNSKDISYNSKKLKSSAKKDTDFVDNVNDNISIVLDDSKSNINLDDDSEVNYDDGDCGFSTQSSVVSSSYSYNSILSGANYTSNYISRNKHLPSFVSIDGRNVSLNDFLYLTCSSINVTSNVTLNNTYNYNLNSIGTNCNNVRIYKYEYLTLADNIIRYYDVNHKNPNHVIVNNKSIAYDDLVYFYTRIATWKYTHNGALPNHMVVIALYNVDYSTDILPLKSTSTQPFIIDTKYTKLANGNYNLTLTSSQNASIYYTTDGTNPTNKSNIYMNTLVLSSKTWLKFYGINKNNQKTPILTFKVNGTPMAYIACQPQKINNYEYKITLTTPTQDKIYYTLDGSIPTKYSNIYTKPLIINNNTILQYFTANTKTSQIYYYTLQEMTPYTTVINDTQVENNKQKIKIIANKPGTIYYTTDGTKPNNTTKKYTQNNLLEISIKTQIQTILIDKNQRQSQITTYKPPYIVTLPITIIKPITNLENNKQTIEFITNRNNTEIYYTTDGINPTMNGNTTRKTTPNTQIQISKQTQLKYYTIDNLGYKSATYTYRTPKNPQERPEITVINTTTKNTKGQQKIMIQTNQPGTIYYTIYSNNNQAETYEYEYIEVVLNTDEKIHTYLQNNKTSKMIEYTIDDKSRTIINYSYTLRIPREYTIHHITFNIGDDLYSVDMDSNNILYYSKNNLFINFEDNTVDGMYKQYTINRPGILLTHGQTLNIMYYDVLYGDISKINVVFLSPKYNTEEIRVFSNYKKLLSIYLTIENNHEEEVETEFQTNINKITKNEVLTYNPQTTSGCSQYDLIQTFIITNTIITPNKYNQTMNEIDNLYNNAYNYVRITPQDRTILEGMYFLMLTHTYADYVAKKLNSTTQIIDEAMCMVGIENNRMNYIHYNNPLQAMIIQDQNQSKQIIFNMYLSVYSYQFAKFTLNTVKYNIASTTMDELEWIIENISSNVKFILDNQTKEITIQSEATENLTITYNIETGIINCIMLVDGFKYKGAITENLTSETTNTTKSLKKLSTLCFEDELSSKFKDKTKNLFGMPLDGVGVAIENLIGGCLMAEGYGLFLAGLAAGCNPLIMCGGVGMIGLGFFLMVDSNGIITDSTNLTRLGFTVIDLGLTFCPATLLEKHMVKVLKIIDKIESPKIAKTAKIAVDDIVKYHDDYYEFLFGESFGNKIKEDVEPYLNGSKHIWGWT